MRKRALVVAGLALLSLASCGGGDEDALDAPSEVTGVVVDISSRGIGQVDSFDLKDADRIYEVHIADDVDYGFDPSHLTSHMTGALPVTVRLEERDGRLYALSIEDAELPGLGS